MKIMLLGNAPWTQSGYGEQIALLIPRLQELGHEIAVAANYGLQGAVMPWNGVPVYPSQGWGNDAIGHYAEHFGADVVICLHDAWVMKPDAWPDDFRMAIYAPVDHYPVPPLVLAVLRHEKVQPIAMSRFGEDWMTRMQLDPLYAPHCYDPAVFHPHLPESRQAARDVMGIPRDAFLVGMVGANRGWSPQVSRKAFPQAIQAFADFLPGHPDAFLYLHTEGKPSERGMQLEALILALNAAQPGLIDRIRFPTDRDMLLGLTREQLAAQYSAMDVLLQPSMAEGFGVPALEAQACGTPVIVSDHSAMTELSEAGWRVDGDAWWDSMQTSFAFMPYIPSIVDALKMAYIARGDETRRHEAAEFARRYEADRIVRDYWVPVLEALASPREVGPLNGRARKKARKRLAAQRRVAA